MAWAERVTAGRMVVSRHTSVDLPVPGGLEHVHIMVRMACIAFSFTMASRNAEGHPHMTGPWSGGEGKGRDHDAP